MRSPLEHATRGVAAAALVGVLAVAGAAVFAGVYARGWWKGAGGSYAPRALVASARITPPSSLFGDVVAADVDVAVDPRRVAPSSVELDPDFRPYRIQSQTARVVRGVGRADVVRFHYELQCLTAPCVALTANGARAGATSRSVQLPAAALVARSRGGAALSAKVTWPPFVVHSRLSAEEVALAQPQLEPSYTPPPVSWRVSPGLVGGLAVSAAVLLALGAGWLVATVLLPDARRLRPRRIPAHLSPVERALRLAEHAAGAGELAEERKALQRLAVELRRAGHGELAGRAGRLAWSEHEPSDDSVGELAAAVRSNGAR